MQCRQSALRKRSPAACAAALDQNGEAKAKVLPPQCDSFAAIAVSSSPLSSLNSIMATTRRHSLPQLSPWPPTHHHLTAFTLFSFTVLCFLHHSTTYRILSTSTVLPISPVLGTDNEALFLSYRCTTRSSSGQLFHYRS